MQHNVLRSLVDICRKHTMVQIIIPESREYYQTMMIGFDIDTKEILLAGIYPAPKVALLDQLHDTEIWLQSHINDQYLKIIAKPLQFLSHGELLSAELISTELTHNRRWTNRATFASSSGPEVELFLHRSANRKSRIVNLSAEGLCIECYGHDLRSEARPNKKIGVEITFNDNFTLRTRIHIKQCTFKRTPCCHSLVRATFEHKDRIIHHQLQDFVNYCVETNTHMNAIEINSLPATHPSFEVA